MENRQLYIDFEAYDQIPEPHKREKASAWRAAIGLQDVDGLKVSDYLKETAVTKAACSVRNFRYRVKGDKIVLLDGLVPSFTVMLPGEELFRIVNCPMEDELDAFLEKAGQRCREQRSFLSEEDSEDLIFLSCVPWFATTAISNEHDTNPEDYFTRISWGMFVEREGRKVLNVTVDVNHRVIDGIHIARFRDELVRLIGTL